MKFPIEHYADLLKTDTSYDVEVKQKRKDLKVIQVNSEDPGRTRKHIVNDVASKIGLTLAVPRKTKANGFMLLIVPDDGSEEGVIIYIKKGGQHRGGRKNELNFQAFIKNQLEEKGSCQLHVSDNYGVTVDLDIVDVVDTSMKHGERGDLNRADTTVELRDGTIYGISQKKTNATYVCKVKKMLKDLLFGYEQKLRNYAKANGLNPGDYMDIRITNRELINLCWFGTDIATGAAFIGDLENIEGNNIQIERIIQNGDDDVLTSFPIYVKWLITNKAYTMAIQGVCVPAKDGKWVIDDLILPGINAPLDGKKGFKVGKEEPKKHRRRHHRKGKVNEDLTTEEQLMEEARQNDMWDTVAYCAENHKMVWLKYETVEDGEIISRRVGPYSYRTRNTKVRGRSTYFYADDFTPGQEKGIKCFLIENCLQVKESPTSFTPRFPIEIKQEIDRLEKQRQDKEKEKDQDQKVDDKLNKHNGDNDQGNTGHDNDELVNRNPDNDEPNEKEPVEKEPVEQPKKEPVNRAKPEIPAAKPAAKPQKPATTPMNGPKKPEPPRKEEPKKVDNGKVDVKPIDTDEPQHDNQENNGADKGDEAPSEDNEVTIGGKEGGEDELQPGEVEVTDDEGNKV